MPERKRRVGRPQKIGRETPPKRIIFKRGNADLYSSRWDEEVGSSEERILGKSGFGTGDQTGVDPVTSWIEVSGGYQLRYESERLECRVARRN